MVWSGGLMPRNETTIWWGTCFSGPLVLGPSRLNPCWRLFRVRRLPGCLVGWASVFNRLPKDSS